jgi:hypothetical protein
MPDLGKLSPEMQAIVLKWAEMHRASLADPLLVEKFLGQAPGTLDSPESIRSRTRTPDEAAKEKLAGIIPDMITPDAGGMPYVDPLAENDGDHR